MILVLNGLSETKEPILQSIAYYRDYSAMRFNKTSCLQSSDYSTFPILK